ncbi:MAG: hypothetical protein IK086_04325 [Clostridia bacterium]|nr:hypothetical protein [Clostridia bacterium]
MADYTGPVGFSSRVNDPEILAAVKKSRGIAKAFGLILVPLPFIGFLVYSLITGEMETSEAMLYGAIISGVFLVFALYGFIRERAANSYEATVIDKKHIHRARSNSGRDEYIDEYVTVVRTTDGKKKKIREYGGRIWAYNYLEVGDRFRYHPQFAFPYELYDKSKANVIYCVSCQTANPVSRDRCERCGLPLLK